MRRVLRRWTLLWMAVILLSVHAQAEGKAFRRQTMDYFSTVCMLTIYPENNVDGQTIWQEVKATLARIEQAVSVSDASSDVARFNTLQFGEETAVSSDTAAMLKIAMLIHEQTDGLYDPTVYPLIDLWGFSPRFNEQVYTLSMPYDRAYVNGLLPLPEEKYIEALRQLVQLRSVTLTERDGQFFLRKDIPPVTVDGVTYQAMLDLGGIAKGYACDRVLALLRERGCTMGYFVCGGSSMALLSRPDADGAYALTLRKPRKGAGSASHYATLRARDTTLSTSGDYSHSFVSDGIIYCHIIDPRTGYPINMPDETGIQHGIASATLLCPSAAYGDALTTALCILGPQEAEDFLKRIPSCTVVMAAYTSDEKTFQVFTNASPDEMTLDDPAYQFALEQGDF